MSYVIGQSNYFGFGFTTLKRKPLYLRGSGSVRLIKWWKDTESIEELMNLSNLHGDGSEDVTSKARFKRRTLHVPNLIPTVVFV